MIELTATPQDTWADRIGIRKRRILDIESMIADNMVYSEFEVHWAESIARASRFVTSDAEVFMLGFLFASRMQETVLRHKSPLSDEVMHEIYVSRLKMFQDMDELGLTKSEAEEMYLLEELVKITAKK